MKKKLFAIIAFTLVTIFALSGCEGCVIMPELVVNNAFNGGSGETAFDPQTGYTETLKYDVKYSDEGIAPNLKDAKNIKFSFSFGTYQTNFEVLSAFPTEIDGTKLESNILTNLADNDKQAYHLKSKFSVEVNYVIDGVENKRTDSIESEVYFCNRSLAYAPVYSKTTSSYTVLQMGSKSGLPIIINSTSQILYQKENYKVDFSYYYNNFMNEKLEEQSSSKTYDYAFKTITDNTMLLFMIRNSKIDFENTIGVPVVTPNYGKAESLAINNANKETRTLQLNYNYQPYQVELSLSKLRFSRNEINSSGTQQILYVQNNVENSPIPYKALPVIYNEPLTTFGTFQPMGQLVYTLTEIII